jgi:uncharacterized phage protein gp47/JayE
MAYFQSETRKTILQRMVNYVVARSSLKDLLSVSQLLHVLAAASRGIEKAQHGMEDILDDRDIDNVIGADLDDWAKVILPVVIERIPGRTATGQVRFGRTGIVGTINQSVGTQVKVPAGAAGEDLLYTTTSLGTISAGSTTSNLVDIVAIKQGTKYNADPGEIDAFVSKPPGVETVTNPTALTNGLDKETDDEFRKRIKAHILGLARCHNYGLEAAAINTYDSVSGKTCIFAKSVEDPDNPGYVVLYVDDGAGTAEHTTTVTDENSLSPASGVASGGEVDIYTQNKPIKEENAFTLKINAATIPSANYSIDYPAGHIKLNSASYPSGLTAADTVTESYTYYDQLIGEVQKVIDGVVADRTNYPGYRAGGIQVKVKPPQILAQSCVVNVTVKSGYSQTTAITSVVAEISAYINGLSVGEDVIRNELIERIMAVPGVYDANMTTPSANVVVGDYQVARITTAAIQAS